MIYYTIIFKWSILTDTILTMYNIFYKNVSKKKTDPYEIEFNMIMLIKILNNG